jgi:hypothetical protein
MEGSKASAGDERLLNMGNHYIHYLTRRITSGSAESTGDPEWYTEDQAGEAGFDQPRFHRTRSRHGPAARIAPGDTIWLIARLRSPWGSLPPAVDARVDVMDVAPQEGGGFRYAAGPGSRWFPLVDATSVLQRLEVGKADGTRSVLWRDRTRSIGIYLRSLRLLANPEVLRRWEAEVEALPRHFVSYRLADGTRAAFEHVASLLDGSPRAVLWDRWSLPRRLVERREQISGAAVDARIVSQIAEAEVVWGIESPRYDEVGSYSRLERRQALLAGIYRAVTP